MSLDDIFKAYDIRGKVPEELNPEISYQIAKAFADYLPTDGTVAVGRDMRPDSKEINDGFIKGLVEQGRNVMDIGQITSDMAYFAVGNFKLAGGVVITASHNDAGMNGIKLYRDGANPVGLDSGMSKILQAIKQRSYKQSKRNGSVSNKDISERWVDHALNFIEPNKFKFIRVGVDAGNGMAGLILPKVEKKLPAKIERLYYELDGSFPNHPANPMHPENLKDLSQIVRNQKLDFGIAFDGDGDRAMFVDELGQPVSGSVMIGLLAEYTLNRHPRSAIVFDVRTSRGVVETIKRLGGKPIRTKAGRVNIGPVMKQHNAAFGGETTGHLFFKENYFVDSGLIGALVAMQAIVESGKTLSELSQIYQPYATVPEQSFEVGNQKEVLNKLAAEFATGKQNTMDGLTVEYEDWWFNIRPSNTEPVIKLNIEATDKNTLASKLKELTAAIRN